MSAAEYAEYLFLKEIQEPTFDRKYAARWLPSDMVAEGFHSYLRKAFKKYGFDAGPEYYPAVEKHVKAMIEAGAIDRDGDQYTEQFWCVLIDRKDEYCRTAIAGSNVGVRLERLGDIALERALTNLAHQEGWGKGDEFQNPMMVEDKVEVVVDQQTNIPAADRIVLLSDNQQIEMDHASNELVELFERENSLDGDVELKDRFIGQIKAARELIRSQSVRAYLLYEAAFQVLTTLVKRYKEHAIGHAAKKLLDLLIESVFKN